MINKHKLHVPFTNQHHLQYIPRNMHTVFALLCFVVVIHWLIFPYPSGLLHWHCGNLTIAPVPAKQPWWIWINTSCEFIMNDCIFLGIYCIPSLKLGHGQRGTYNIFTVYPKKYAHGFVVLCFVVVIISVKIDSQVHNLSWNYKFYNEICLSSQILNFDPRTPWIPVCKQHSIVCWYV